MPAYVCAVWWRRANAPGALVSMVAGAGVAFLWQFGGLDAATGLHAMLAGLLSSTVMMIVVSLATRKVAPVPPRILELMTEAAHLGATPRGGAPPSIGVLPAGQGQPADPA